MHRFARLASLITLAAAITGCTTSKHWTVTGAQREEGLVRVSYEYPEFHEPVLSEKQAATLAQNRCEGWGYDDAEPIAGQLRQCSNMDDGNCNLWMVTREFQCTREVAQANLAAK
jgi:YecR-like lipoprotein